MKKMLVSTIATMIVAISGWYIYQYIMPRSSGEFCIQVITSATNPITGAKRDFPTPCAVPRGWEVTTHDQ